MDSFADAARRIDAIAGLGEAQTSEAVDVLLVIGARAREPDVILQTTGRALGRCARRVAISEWDMRDLTAVTFRAIA